MTQSINSQKNSGISLDLKVKLFPIIV